ncbi:MAG: glycosyltransferase family 8 protein [Bacilli bacterium]|nr:glycosyltransferase family 8 protein [Bacilli bacterium]
MNILYCGDNNITNGLIISILSLIKHTDEELNIYVLTMKYEKYKPLSKDVIKVLDKKLKEKNKNSKINLIDITNKVIKCLPTANLSTRFTPYCMLRLYADKVDELPSKIIYLDNDVVALKDFTDFYNLDITNYDIAGVFDYYGSHIYRKKIIIKDYLNSGVLLMNLDKIKENNLFEKCRIRCRDKEMLLPDQEAINTYCSKKLIVNRIYNEQHKTTNKTVFRHYTTTFKFFPKVRTQTIKPWMEDELHNILKDYRIDDILEEYKKIKDGLI